MSQALLSTRDCRSEVFRALGVKNLTGDIRSLSRKSNLGHDSATGVRDASQAPQTSSFVVTFKSSPVRAFVIDKKRAKRNLTVTEVFEMNMSGKIYVNQLISSTAYDLLKRTKAEVAATAHKFVWTRAGNILVRRENGAPIILISTDSGLAKLS